MIQKLLGINRHIDENTFSHRLNYFNFKSSNQLQEILRGLGLKVRKGYLSGNQEGSRKGYNDKKKGQKSFHPQMAFVSSTRECLHSWFRPGNTYSANGTSEFIKECYACLSEDVIPLFRCDSAYFDNKTMSVIEERDGLYLIKVKLRNMKHLLCDQSRGITT